MADPAWFLVGMMTGIISSVVGLVLGWQQGFITWVCLFGGLYLIFGG